MEEKYEDLANKVRDIPLGQVAYELGLEPDPETSTSGRILTTLSTSLAASSMTGKS
jgi:hypothetical protein